MTVDEVAEKIRAHGGKSGRKRGDNYELHCPAHEDGTPSLGVRPGDKPGTVIVYCHGGCDTKDVLDRVGLRFSDLSPDTRKPIDPELSTPLGDNVYVDADAVYRYTDEQGKLLFGVNRCRHPETGRKEFRQWRPDPSRRFGRTWKLDDTKRGIRTRRVLYRLPEVVAAVESGETIYVAEGEKDVHALERAGVIATTMPGGVGVGWKESYSKTLAGADVIVIADRDGVDLKHPKESFKGQRHAVAVAESLRRAGCAVRIVQALEGKDPHDHLTAGHGVEDLADLDAEAMQAEYQAAIDTPAEGEQAAIPAAAPTGTDLHAPVPGGFLIPDGYTLDRDGVNKITQVRQKDGTSYDKIDPVASSPCMVSGILRDPSGEELVELAWEHYGRWQRRAVPRSVTRSGRRMVTQLGDAGFPIMDSRARVMEQWLDAVETANRTRLPIRAIARHLGWQADGTFVTGDGPWPVHAAAGDGQDKIIAGHTAKGDLKDWQKTIEQVRDYPLALMAVYAALAATLLRPLGLHSFTTDFSGLTTTGKTTCAELGLSVFADPQTAIAYWNSTRVAIERRFALVQGLPVLLDETSNAPNAEVVRDVLYAIPTDREKSRGSLDGTRPALTWQTVVITTGERPIVSWTNDGGTAGRVLTLEGSPFGEDGGTVATNVREGCYAAHGTAGPAFIAKLQEMLANNEGRSDLRLMHQAATVTFATGSNLNRRRAPLAAALYVAATLAHKWDIVPFPAPPVPVWEDLLSRDDPRDDRPAAALARIHAWIAANPHRIRGRAPRDREGQEMVPHAGWAGKTMNDGAVAIFEEEIRRELGRGPSPFELDAVKGAWAATGAIRRQGAHMGRLVRFDGALQRMYVLEPSATTGTETETETETEED